VEYEKNYWIHQDKNNPAKKKLLKKWEQSFFQIFKSKESVIEENKILKDRVFTLFYF
jgi:hypothetical protein